MTSGSIKGWIRNAALVAAIALPLAAAAQQAVVSAGGNLRAGPSRDYPLVAQLAPGTPATVMGCIDGYGWCDIVVPGGLRGWLYSGRLDYAYQNALVPMVGIGAAIGVPIVTFALTTYWNSYYRDRPWYGQSRWWGGGRPLPPVSGWRPSPSPAPSWRPRQPPAQWRPPQQQQHRAVIRPQARPQATRLHVQPQQQRPQVARPQMARPQVERTQAPAGRPPERRDTQNNHR